MEFKKFLGPNIDVIETDLKEPKADSITIVRYKASQFRDTVVDDTSLEVVGAEIGPEVRWKLKDLESWLGHKAVFVCLLGIRRGDEVYVFEGRVEGQIVAARGEGFGFNPVFQPLGSSYTLAEEQQPHHNARFLAVENLKKGLFIARLEPLFEWSGDFQ